MNSKMRNFMSALIVLLMVLVGCATTPTPAPKTPTPAKPSLALASTTSTQDSGLMDVLIPLFEKKTGYKVKPSYVGSGAALQMGAKGDADVLLVHSPTDEKKLVDDKTITDYKLVMHNDFLIVGPANDPAKIKGTKSAADAFKAIAAAKATFISRGDKSGTNSKEASIWKKTDVTTGGSAWYKESGQGMGPTLKMAAEKGAYTLTDRATYLATKNDTKLEIMVEGDKSLLNIYHVAMVNPDKFPSVNKDGAKAFVDFMVSKECQANIATFGKVKYGQSLFIPDAGKTEDQLGK